MTDDDFKDVVITHNGHVITGKRQKQIYDIVRAENYDGATDQEVQDAIDRGHGTTSGSLSTLHKHGHLALLAEKRFGLQIYVGSEYVAGRETVPHKKHKNRPTEPTHVHWTGPRDHRELPKDALVGDTCETYGEDWEYAADGWHQITKWGAVPSITIPYPQIDIGR